MTDQPIDPKFDQVKLTAYALGELEEADAAEVELLLSGDETARKYVDLVRQEAQVIGRAYHARSASLTEAQHTALTDAIGDRPKEPSLLKPLVIAAGLAAAACFVILLLLPGLGASRETARHLSQGQPAPVESPDQRAGAGETLGGEAMPAALAVVGKSAAFSSNFFGSGGNHRSSRQSPAGPLDPASIPTTPYTVAEGDTLSSIALAKYGDASKHNLIALVNRGILPDPDQIKPGMELLLPDLERWRDPSDRESYDRIVDNPFLKAVDNPLSTFSIDVDTASYANARRHLLNDGKLPPKDAVRIEEFVNYFTYDYSDGMKPAKVVAASAEEVDVSDVPFTSSVEIAPAPWSLDHRLVRIGLKGKEPTADERPAANIVFLLDVSGSMDSPDKLPLLKRAFKLFTNELSDKDRVAIVVYAGAAGLVLPSTEAGDRQKILDALDQLQAGGSTAGGAGIQLAYQVAQENDIEGGINRVILATDGDFNVGTSDTGALTRLVEEKANPPADGEHAGKAVYLSVLGFGSGNLNDAMMEQITNKGNGNYFYIDSVTEAQKVLVEQMGGTLQAIAKDVKIQVEFNPAQVESYRLIGYENRLLRKEDFNDDTIDAGDIGAGHTVTALYEVVPVSKGVSPWNQAAPVQVGETLQVDIEDDLGLRDQKPPYRFTLTVPQDGSIALPGIGKIDVAGKDASQIEATIVDMLDREGVVKDATVSVRIDRHIKQRTGPFKEDDEYVLQPGDIVTCTIPELIVPGGGGLQNRRIRDDGTIAMPVLGSTRFAGMTRVQAAEQIKQKLERDGILKDATVDITVSARGVPPLTRAQAEAKIKDHLKAISNIEGLMEVARLTPEKHAALARQITEHRSAIRDLRAKLEPAAPKVDDLKYQEKPKLSEAAGSGELMTLKLRYKAPDAEAKQGTSTLLSFPIRDAGAGLDQASGDFKFAASVAGFGMLLRDSPYKGDATFASVAELAELGKGEDPRGYRAQLIEMVHRAAELDTSNNE